MLVQEEKSTPVCILIGQPISVARLSGALITGIPGHAKYKQYVGGVASFYEAATLIAWLSLREGESYRFFVSATDTSLEQIEKEDLYRYYSQPGSHVFRALLRGGLNWNNFQYPERFRGGHFMWDVLSAYDRWRGGDPRRNAAAAFACFSFARNVIASSPFPAYTDQQSVADCASDKKVITVQSIEHQRAHLEEFYANKKFQSV